MGILDDDWSLGLDFNLTEPPPDDYETLARIIDRHGDDGVTAINLLMKIFEAGKQVGRRDSYHQGYLQGVSDTQAKALDSIQASTNGTVSVNTPIGDLSGLYTRVRFSLARYIRATNKEHPHGTLGDILLTPASEIFGIRNFGRVAGEKLAEYLLHIGYTDKAKEIADYMQTIFKP